MSSKGRKSIARQPFRAGERGLEQILGSRQGSIMEHLWKNGPQTPSALHAALQTTDGIAYTTVHTELSRLVKKGFVRKPSRAGFLYDAVLSREQFISATVNSVLQGLMESNRSAAIHGFVDLVSGDEEAYDELKRVLREHKRR